jgi:hypothetical protein
MFIVTNVTLFKLWFIVFPLDRINIFNGLQFMTQTPRQRLRIACNHHSNLHSHLQGVFVMNILPALLLSTCDVLLCICVQSLFILHVPALIRVRL